LKLHSSDDSVSVTPSSSNDALVFDLKSTPALLPLVVGATSGTNTYIATPSPALAAYITDKPYIVQVVNANTGAATLNISGLGAKNIYKNGAALAGGEIDTGAWVLLTYDGTQFQMTGDGGGSSGGGSSGGGSSFVYFA
jgi:hypothetical protein